MTASRIIKINDKYLSDFRGVLAFLDSAAVEYLLALPEHDLVKLLTSRHLYGVLHSKIRDDSYRSYLLLDQNLDRYMEIVYERLASRH
jgi:hypothetical protein